MVFGGSTFVCGSAAGASLYRRQHWDDLNAPLVVDATIPTSDGVKPNLDMPLNRNGLLRRLRAFLRPVKYRSRKHANKSGQQQQQTPESSPAKTTSTVEEDDASRKSANQTMLFFDAADNDSTYVLPANADLTRHRSVNLAPPSQIDVASVKMREENASGLDLTRTSSWHQKLRYKVRVRCGIVPHRPLLAQQEAILSEASEDQDEERCDDDEITSAHFSVSTGNKTPVSSVRTGGDLTASTSSSMQGATGTSAKTRASSTAKRSDGNDVDDESREPSCSSRSTQKKRRPKVSLRDYFAKDVQKPENKPLLDFCDASIHDNNSVGSAQLVVSFDEAYAQLIFKATESDDDDDDDSDDDDIPLNAPSPPRRGDCMMGVRFPHPASGSLGSLDTKSRASRASANCGPATTQCHPQIDYDTVWNHVSDNDDGSTARAVSELQIVPSTSSTSVRWSFSHHDGDDDTASLSTILNEATTNRLQQDTVNARPPASHYACHLSIMPLCLDSAARHHQLKGDDDETLDHRSMALMAPYDEEESTTAASSNAGSARRRDW